MELHSLVKNGAICGQFTYLFIAFFGLLLSEWVYLQTFVRRHEIWCQLWFESMVVLVVAVRSLLG